MGKLSWVAGGIVILAVFVIFAWVYGGISENNDFQNCMASQNVTQDNWFNTQTQQEHPAIGYCRMRTKKLPDVLGGMNATVMFLGQIPGMLWQPGIIIGLIFTIIAIGIVLWGYAYLKNRDTYSKYKVTEKTRPIYFIFRCWVEKTPRPKPVEVDGDVEIIPPDQRVFVVNVFDLTIEMWSVQDSLTYSMKSFKKNNPNVDFYDREILRERDLAEKIVEKVKAHISEREKMKKELTINERYFSHVNIGTIDEMHWFAPTPKSPDARLKETEAERNKMFIRKMEYDLFKGKGGETAG